MFRSDVAQMLQKVTQTSQTRHTNVPQASHNVIQTSLERRTNNAKHLKNFTQMHRRRTITAITSVGYKKFASSNILFI